jgi:hypothetical protein
LNEKVVIQCPDAPTPTLAIAKLKEFIRHVAKEEPLQENFITEIQQTLPFPS